MSQLVKPFYKFSDLTPMQKRMAEVQGVSGFEQKFTLKFLWVMEAMEALNNDVPVFDTDDIYDFLAEYMILGFNGFSEKYKKYLDICIKNDERFFFEWQRLRADYTDIDLRDPTIFFEKLRARLQKDLADLDAVLKRAPVTPNDLVKHLLAGPIRSKAKEIAAK